jgi:hypothetical protein
MESTSSSSSPDQASEFQADISGISSKLEMLSKVAAASAILVYACGYLVTSVYHAHYGITQTSPLRPRILSAGAWFTLFIAIPIWTILVALGKDRLTFGKFGRFLFPYWVTCTFLSIFPAMLFTFSDDSSFRIKWWRIGVLLVCIAIISIPFARKLPKSLATISIAFTVFFIQLSLADTVLEHRFGYEAITLWLFFIGMIVMMELTSREPPRLVDPKWIRTFFMGLLALWVFARYFYPEIKADWGGGAPIPITIYFTKDSVILPGKSTSALLIDETDAGLYVISGNEKKAIFIPRTEVAVLYFSDNINNSNLLKEIKASPFVEPSALAPDSIHNSTDNPSSSKVSPK